MMKVDSVKSRCLLYSVKYVGKYIHEKYCECLVGLGNNDDICILVLPK